jgi:chemotaxis signal transduction protein
MNPGINQHDGVPNGNSADAAALLLKEFRRRAEILARRGSRQQERRQTCAVLAFRLSTERFGIELARVVQVYSNLNCSPLPGARSELLGVTNLRGRIYSVVDLALILELSQQLEASQGYIVVVRHAGVEVGVRVDAVEQIEQLTPDQFSASNGDLDTLSTPYVQSRTASGLAMLNLEAVFSHPVFGGDRRSDKPLTAVAGLVDVERPSSPVLLEPSPN